METLFIGLVGSGVVVSADGTVMEISSPEPELMIAFEGTPPVSVAKAGSSGFQFAEYPDIIGRVQPGTIIHADGPNLTIGNTPELFQIIWEGAEVKKENSSQFVVSGP